MGPKHRPELDGLRAVAALAVLLFHEQAPGFQGGARGLDIFFVLSGYLVTGVIWRELEQTGRLHLGAFLTRRILRLAPALYVVIAAHLILTPLLTPQFAQYAWQDALYAATYLQEYASYPRNAPSAIGHAWSLSIEMQFYILWPLLLIGGRRLGQRRTATLCVIAWIALTGWRLM
jgi:peptidoglycan/LPS O-acetylase OafA/YrhL